ncbi:hypothetical protein [Endozoicomonas sp. ALB115]|uniref:hypothetical protein n=1 Tax=Endozoicomonas sp. ALB115 TaxID=3403074 RepID=UPI003BB48C91
MNEMKLSADKVVAVPESHNPSESKMAVEWIKQYQLAFQSAFGKWCEDNQFFDENIQNAIDQAKFAASRSIAEIMKPKPYTDKTIYILKLEGGRYYVGQCGSNRVEPAIKSHFNGKGSPWTQKNKPVGVVDRFFGDKEKLKQTTLEYMRKFGWENVRGYAWTAWNLKYPPKEL